VSTTTFQNSEIHPRLLKYVSVSPVSNQTDLIAYSVSAKDEVVVVGRITLDADSSTSGAAKLNEASIALESSRMMGSGERVPLRFDAFVRIRGGAKNAGAVGLFSGAIVALRGKNGGGGWFLANEILVVNHVIHQPSYLLAKRM
jgi:hypothetical protein